MSETSPQTRILALHCHCSGWHFPCGAHALVLAFQSLYIGRIPEKICQVSYIDARACDPVRLSQDKAAQQELFRSISSKRRDAASSDSIPNAAPHHVPRLLEPQTIDSYLVTASSPRWRSNGDTEAKQMCCRFCHVVPSSSIRCAALYVLFWQVRPVRHWDQAVTLQQDCL